MPLSYPTSTVAGRLYAYRPHPLNFSNRALFTGLHGAGPQERRASVCGSAAGVPLNLPRSPTADRSPFYRRVWRDTRRDSAYC